MKKHTHNPALKSLASAVVALGIMAVPVANADETTTIVETQRTPLKTEVTETFVEGYTVPDQYRTYFAEFPEIEEENVVVRYHNGRAFYVNSDNWKIVRVVKLDPSVEVKEEESVFVEGYVIPEEGRTQFIDVPRPEEKMEVRYYNNTAYYVDSDFRIVRTVRLTR